jgi:pyrroline-5-carboxylate reductase
LAKGRKRGINKAVGFIGAGNMAEALIKGLISARAVSPAGIFAFDKNKDRLLSIAQAYEVKVFSKNFEVARASDIVVLAVKPGDCLSALSDIASEMSREKLLVSIVAGKRTDALEAALLRAGSKGPVPIVRAMPNTPATIGEGATALFRGEGVTDTAFEAARGIFRAVGEIVTIRDESTLDSVTGVSGSGPAYVFLFMEALIEAAIKEGIPEADAKRLVLKTTAGAAKMAMGGKKELPQLITTVTSPGGTTAEALKVFEKEGFKEIMEKAVRAAVKRAKELAQG